jgi:hypothetical protein
MAFKTIGALLISLLISLNSNAQALNPDSVVYQVFDALTAEPMVLPNNLDELLIGPEWEALAYWEVGQPKQLEYLNEAVGDVYQFQPTSFVIKLVDPNNPRTYLKSVTGSLKREGRNLELIAANGNQLAITIIFIDKNYLVIELDGLRLFFSQSRSFNAR